MLTVCACDPQPIALEGLRSILEGTDDIRYGGGASNLLAGLGLMERVNPSVMLLDRAFGSKPLLDWIASSKLRYPQTRTVLWATVISDLESFRALQAGACGVLKKSASIEAVLHCLRAAAQGQVWTETFYSAADGRLGAGRSRPLTPREQQIINLVSRGLKNREIAAALSIATGTVKIHMMHIFEKTGIRDRFELALHGLKLAVSPALATEHASVAALEDKVTTPVL